MIYIQGTVKGSSPTPAITLCACLIHSTFRMLAAPSCLVLAVAKTEVFFVWYDSGPPFRIRCWTFDVRPARNALKLV